MRIPQVPDGDELSIDGMRLGRGGQVRANHAPGRPSVAWATTGAVPQPGRHWAYLAERAAQTGLQPILLSGLRGKTQRPWDEGEFAGPDDTASIDEYDTAQTLSAAWPGQDADSEELAGEDPEWVVDYLANFEPYGGQFPGLAPAIDEEIDPQLLARALGQLTPPARIGVVPAARPADVLPRLGWQGSVNWDWPPAQVAAVLRSWEDRFGARLYDVGFAAIRLLFTKPPMTLEAALPIAAEHRSLCDECGRMGLTAVRRIAETIVGNPFWDFWWD